MSSTTARGLGTCRRSRWRVLTSGAYHMQLGTTFHSLTHRAKWRFHMHVCTARVSNLLIQTAKNGRADYHTCAHS